MAKKRTKRHFIASFLSGAFVLLLAWWVWQGLPGNNFEAGFWVVQKAYLSKQSGMKVEVSGEVIRVLTDEKSGARHQRFVIQMKNGQDVIVLHNISSSERVPVSIRDQITVRGEYVWSETGGAIRWTERDFSPQRRSGWIEHEGVRYD